MTKPAQIERRIQKLVQQAEALSTPAQPGSTQLSLDDLLHRSTALLQLTKRYRKLDRRLSYLRKGTGNGPNHPTT